MSLYEFDRSQKKDALCGVDEAGRGPLAGPVVAAAVILPLDLENEIEGLNDSKKLSEKKREKLYGEILDKAISFGVGIASVQEIDEINILQATFLAMRRAVENLKISPGFVLVDGNKDPGLPTSSKFVIKGDAKSASIAAASIIAKVTRDRMMMQLDKKYPMYNFAKHKGYGTKLHNELIVEHGISPVHRQTFLKKLKEKQPNISLLLGKFGEQLAYGYLKKKGYDVIVRNYHSEYGEIDLIATTDKYLCFVEVKLRDKTCAYAPREAVVKSKQRKIVKTAICFMQKHPCNKQPRFDVMEIYNAGDDKCTINFIENAFCPEEEYGFL